jgi:hypothetical protein
MYPWVSSMTERLKTLPSGHPLVDAELLVHEELGVLAALTCSDLNDQRFHVDTSFDAMLKVLGFELVELLSSTDELLSDLAGFSGAGCPLDERSPNETLDELLSFSTSHKDGAGDGTRTRFSGLEGQGTTHIPHPRVGYRESANAPSSRTTNRNTMKTAGMIQSGKKTQNQVMFASPVSFRTNRTRKVRVPSPGPMLIEVLPSAMFPPKKWSGYSESNRGCMLPKHACYH